MKTRTPSVIRLALLFTGVGIVSASAAVSTLTSPDGNWRLQSDEFGAYGAGLPGGGAFHNFGAGIIDYSWAASVLITDGINRQALSSNTGAGWTGATLGAGNVISDSVAGNTRTSSYSVSGFPALSVSLTQTAANSGISQTYVLSNSGATPLSLSVLEFHDADLDGSTWTNNRIVSSGGALSVTEGSRFVRFSPASPGYQGFLAGHFPAGGITGNLDIFVFNNFGIPGGNLNQFVEIVAGPSIGPNFDINADGVSDSPGDVGFVFQNNINIPAGGSISLTYASVPEPSAALIGLLTLGLAARRRR